MHIKRFFSGMTLLALLVLLSSTVVQAQEDTAEETELETTTLNEFSVTHPDDWSVLEANPSTYVIANLDLEGLASNADLPEGTVIMQILLAGRNLIPLNEDGSRPNAADILDLLRPEQDAALEIQDIEIEGMEPLARVQRDEPDSEANIYTVLVDDSTFALLVVTSNEIGLLAEEEDTLLDIIESITVDYTVTLPEGLEERYSDLATGTTEEGFPQLGNPEAPVTVTEISSFDCPACGQFHSLTFPLLLERIAAGEVLFTYVPIFGTGSIPAGDQAARAALCAAEQGSFWQYHDLLFSWQQLANLAFADARLDSGAEALELDSEAFEACTASERPDEIITTAQETAQNTPGFQGTPTVLVNGTQVNGSPEIVMAAIDEALSGGEEAPESDEAGTEDTDE